MTPEKREKVSELFEAALEREPNQRDVFLDDACSDEEIRAEVKSLLAGHERAGNFMDEPLLKPLYSQTPFVISEGVYSELSERHAILVEVGRGGMGIVFKAHDRTTEEVVALKVLSTDLACDQEALERFKNELRLARKITHKNVCRIYDIHLLDSTAYISMEFVDGESLREILRRFGPLSRRRGIEIALQICDGLEEAHNQEVVHGDLKPGNIMVDRSGNVKVMDFGIARSVGTGIKTGTADFGTPAYMAPEQARGEKVEVRTDIYALGLVLYEMFAGTPAFMGDTPSILALKQIDEIPRPPCEIEPTIGSQIDRVILRCLEKEPANRYHSLRELKSALTKAADWRTNAPGPRLRVYLALASLVAVGVVVGLLLWKWNPSVDAQPTAVLALDLPRGDRLAGLGLTAVTFSPSARELTYVAEREGIQQLFRRAINSPETNRIPGTEGALSPFYSPDGQSLGFCADGKLKRVALNGGTPVALAPVFSGCGASWGNNDQIVYSPGWTTALVQVSAVGGLPKALTTLDRKKGEESHRFPHFLPSGRDVLFTVGTGGNWDDARIEVLQLDTGRRKILITGGSDGRYVPTGHIVFVRGARILAVPFDLARLEVTGPAVPLLGGIMPSVDKTGAAPFSSSNIGWLAYVPGDVKAEDRRLVWVDRAGKEQP